MALSIGSQVPDITLKSLSAEGLVDVSLRSHVGEAPIVVLFFPAAFTGVCTQEMCDISKGLPGFGDIKVYGISPDAPFSQAAWAKQEGITTTLLSDYQRQAAQAFDVVLSDLAGLGPGSKRAAFLIDKDGTVKYSEETATPGDLPNFAALAEAIQGL